VRRTIVAIRRLVDTTLTWEPAYPATSVELRSQTLALPVEELQGADGLIREQRYGGYVVGLKRSPGQRTPAQLDAYFATCRARIAALEAGATSLDELPPLN
jgi:hypothetical protein